MSLPTELICTTSISKCSTQPDVRASNQSNNINLHVSCYAGNYNKELRFVELTVLFLQNLVFYLNFKKWLMLYYLCFECKHCKLSKKCSWKICINYNWYVWTMTTTRKVSWDFSTCNKIPLLASDKDLDWQILQYVFVFSWISFKQLEITICCVFVVQSFFFTCYRPWTCAMCTTNIPVVPSIFGSLVFFQEKRTYFTYKHENLQTIKRMMRQRDQSGH